MDVPASAKYVMQKLRDAGYEARLVGGCVRDMLRGIEPNDWDVCTSARPEQMKLVFASDRVIETGLKHGTLTVLAEGQTVEITCYRAESSYSDFRHPDCVEFVSELREDLARRDFTVNAMAWDEAGGLIDLFGGREDLAAGIIRCVGEAEERFSEDALRMLRALRFAARFDFSIEEKTGRAIHEKKALLHAVSAERVFAELRGLLAGCAAGRVVREYIDVMQGLWPGAEAFDDNAPADVGIRLALLLKAAGNKALDSLRCETALKKQVRELWEARGPETAAELWALQLRYGPERAAQIAAMHGFDNAAATLEASPLKSLRDLAVSGTELTKLGYSGAAVGAALNELADKVLAGALANEKQALLAFIKEKQTAEG